MKLYKYKSLKNFEHVADIICNNRFYAAQYYELNDPMEGLYDCKPGTKKEYLDAIKEGKKRLRICSFSKNSTNTLLWAHYADSFKGICIEVEIGDNPQDFEVKETVYMSTRLLFHNQASRLISVLPELILTQKAEDWSVEKEVRLLTSKQYLKDDIKITRILLGVSMPDVLKKTIIRLAAPGVKIWDTKIASKTNRIVIGGQANHAKELFP